MSMHLCFGCGVPVQHRTLCPACSRKRFEEVKAALCTPDTCPGCSRCSQKREEVRAVCLSDTAHGGPIPPYACGCAACLRSIGLTAARALAVIVALALAACTHPADARPRHYSAASGSGSLEARR